MELCILLAFVKFPPLFCQQSFINVTTIFTGIMLMNNNNLIIILKLNLLPINKAQSYSDVTTG